MLEFKERAALAMPWTEFFKDLGVPPALIGIFAILAALLFWLVKTSLSQILKKQLTQFSTELKASIERATQDRGFLQSQYGTLYQYNVEQWKGLLNAYYRIFEYDEDVLASADTLGRAIRQADSDVMAPLDAYEGILDEETSRHVLSIHNGLVQFAEPNDAAVEHFRSTFASRKSSFYSRINEVKDLISVDKICVRLGLVTSQLKRPTRGE
jgi:hypothetical protein